MRERLIRLIKKDCQMTEGHNHLLGAIHTRGIKIEEASKIFSMLGDLIFLSGQTRVSELWQLRGLGLH